MKRRASTPQEGVQGPLKKQSPFRSPVDGSRSRPSTEAKEGSTTVPASTTPTISPALSSAAVTSLPPEEGPSSVPASTPTVPGHSEPSLPAGHESTDRVVGDQESDPPDHRTRGAVDGNEEAVLASGIDRPNRQRIVEPPPSVRSVEQASKDADLAVDYRPEGVSSVKTTSIELAYIDDDRVDVISKLVSKLSPGDHSYDGDGGSFAGGEGAPKHTLPRDDVGRNGIAVDSAVVDGNAATAAEAAGVVIDAGSSTRTGATIPAADVPAAEILTADIDIPASDVPKADMHTPDLPASPTRDKASTLGADVPETTAAATDDGAMDRDVADYSVGTTTADALRDGAPSKAAPSKLATNISAADEPASSKHAPSGPSSAELAADGRVSSDPTPSGPTTNAPAPSDVDTKGDTKGTDGDTHMTG